MLLYEGSGAHLTYNLEIEIILTFSHFFRNVQVLSVFSSRRHHGWDEGSYGFYLRFFLASTFAYNFVRK